MGQQEVNNQIIGMIRNIENLWLSIPDDSKICVAVSPASNPIDIWCSNPPQSVIAYSQAIAAYRQYFVDNFWSGNMQAAGISLPALYIYPTGSTNKPLFTGDNWFQFRGVDDITALRNKIGNSRDIYSYPKPAPTPPPPPPPQQPLAEIILPPPPPPAPAPPPQPEPEPLPEVVFVPTPPVAPEPIPPVVFVAPPPPQPPPEPVAPAPMPPVELPPPTPQPDMVVMEAPPEQTFQDLTAQEPAPVVVAKSFSLWPWVIAAAVVTYFTSEG